MADRRLSVSKAARFSRYLQASTQAKKLGREVISSQEISQYANTSPSQVRLDISWLGRLGERGVGYDIDRLIVALREVLRVSGQHNVALVGAGQLGRRAMVRSAAFADYGFAITAVFDFDSAKVGSAVGEMRVQSVDALDAAAQENTMIVGVLAVPEATAQIAADALAGAGVKIIINHTDTLIQTPPGVTTLQLSPVADLLHALYFYLG